jgi:hypothetical protein
LALLRVFELHLREHAVICFRRLRHCSQRANRFEVLSLFAQEGILPFTGALLASHNRAVHGFCSLRFGELDDNLDVAILPLEGARKVLRPLPSGDQPLQPRTVCPGERFASLIPVPLVGVDAANDDVVLQDRFCGNIASDVPDSPVTAADTRKANDPSVRYFSYGVGYDRSRAGAFNDDIWPESDVGDTTGMVQGTQSAHEVRLEAGINPIKNVNVQSPLHSEQCREQADWTSTRHKHSPWFPKGAPAYRVDLLPRLCDDGRRFEQNAEKPERTVNFHCVFRLDSPTFRHESVNLFDAPLSVLAVAAHVPFTHRAVGARNGVGTANDADHQITLLESAGWVRVQNAAEGFVAKYEACLAGRWPSVFPLDNLDVGTANTDRDGFHEYRALANIRLWDLFPVSTA